METVHIHGLSLADLRFEKLSSSFQCLTFKRSFEICFVPCNAQKIACDTTKVWSVHIAPDGPGDSSIDCAARTVCSILALFCFKVNF